MSRLFYGGFILEMEKEKVFYNAQDIVEYMVMGWLNDD